MTDNVSLGTKYMLFSSFMFACMGAFAKELSNSMSSIEIVFFRNVFGVILILISIYKTPSIQKGGRPWLLFFRGLVGFAALLFFLSICVSPICVIYISISLCSKLSSPPIGSSPWLCCSPSIF